MKAQELMSGSIVRVMFTERGVTDSHYFNILPDGQRVDFTYRQFSNQVQFTPALTASNEELIATTETYLKAKGFEGSMHDYILSFPKVKERYDLLHKGLKAQIVPRPVLREFLELRRADAIPSGKEAPPDRGSEKHH